MWYPTHSAAYYVSITGGRFTEVSGLGTAGRYAEFQAENNEYKNPFGTESRCIKPVRVAFPAWR